MTDTLRRAPMSFGAARYELTCLRVCVTIRTMTTFLEQVTETEHVAYHLMGCVLPEARLENMAGASLLACPPLSGPRFNHLALIRVPAANDHTVLPLAQEHLVSAGEYPAIAVSPATFPPSLPAVLKQQQMTPWLTEQWLSIPSDAPFIQKSRPGDWTVRLASSPQERQLWLHLLTGVTRRSEVSEPPAGRQARMWLASETDSGAQVAALIATRPSEALVYLSGRAPRVIELLQMIAHLLLSREPTIKRFTFVLPEEHSQLKGASSSGVCSFLRTILVSPGEHGI